MIRVWVIVSVVMCGLPCTSRGGYIPEDLWQPSYQSLFRMKGWARCFERESRAIHSYFEELSKKTLQGSPGKWGGKSLVEECRYLRDFFIYPLKTVRAAAELTEKDSDVSFIMPCDVNVLRTKGPPERDSSYKKFLICLASLQGKAPSKDEVRVVLNFFYAQLKRYLFLQEVHDDIEEDGVPVGGLYRVLKAERVQLDTVAFDLPLTAAQKDQLRIAWLIDVFYIPLRKMMCDISRRRLLWEELDRQVTKGSNGVSVIDASLFSPQAFKNWNQRLKGETAPGPWGSMKDFLKAIEQWAFKGEYQLPPSFDDAWDSVNMPPPLWIPPPKRHNGYLSRELKRQFPGHCADDAVPQQEHIPCWVVPPRGHSQDGVCEGTPPLPKKPRYSPELLKVLLA